MAIPSVMQGLIETEGDKVFELDSPKGATWLETVGSFRFEPAGNGKPYTVRREASGYWYGCRKIAGKVRKKYIGKSSEVTISKLEEIAEALEVLPVPQIEQVAEVAQEVTQDTQVTEKVAQVAEDRFAALELEVASLRKALEALQEALPGKSDPGNSAELPKVDSEVAEQLQNDLSNLNEKLRADYAALLESSTHVTNKLRQELQELRSQLEVEKTLCDELREELEDRKETCAQLERKLAVARVERDETIAERDEISTKLAAALAENKKSAAASQDLPDAVDLSGKAGELLSFFKTLLPKNTKLPSGTISKIEKILEE